MSCLRPPLLLFTLSAVLGCGAGDDKTTPLADAPESALALLAVPCDAAVSDVYAAAAPPASFTEANRGDLVQCAYDRFVTAGEMKAHFADLRQPDPGVTMGAHKLRLSYWTTRGDGEPVLTSAVFYLPAERVGSPSPLLVLGHGSVGVADICAPSREDPKGYLQDARSLAYTVAGDGWVAIMPDNPGLGTEGITGWGYSPDEGRTLLDATRAARKLMKAGELDAKNVLMGHSIGGHAVLSAQAYLESYGVEGTVEATVAFAPIWFSSAVWGAFLSNVGAALATPKLLAVAMKHFYGHLAIEEGEEHALDAFLDDKKQAIQELLENNCWNEVVGNTQGTGPVSIGIMKAVDAFKPEYIAEVGGCGFSGACDTPLAATWRQRWVNDRPPPVTSVPIVIWQGAKDDFVRPDYQKCSIDRLEGQDAELDACIAAEADHVSPMAYSATWVHAYLRHKLLGEAAPAKCPGFETIGDDVKCSIPIPNSTDPNDP